MKTKNIFKALAFAMLMPVMLLTTACGKETVNDENTDGKGFALPVTVNVSREGDDATKATYTDNGNGTGSLGFSTGDKLFVSGNYDDWYKSFAGTLDYDAESGKFKGTIYTEDDTYKTYEDLFGHSDDYTATLLPAGYKDHGYLVINTNDPVAQYDDYIEESGEYTLATSKADGVAQFSYEKSSSYNNGFALSPGNAILNFTITGLAASTSVNVSLTSIAYIITGTVTTDASGNATFAAGIMGGLNLQPFSLTVGGKNITIVSSDKVVEEGMIYNITRNAIPGALIGQFSVSDTKKVYFSKGNLQYTKSTGKWSFMDHQYSTVETTGQAIGVDYASQNVVSLFGWGTSGWNNGNTYYQPYNTAYVNSSSNGYGYGPKNGTTYTYDLTGTYANADWGLNNAISNGGNTAGTWRTLTKDEWEWLLGPKTSPNPGTNCRTSSTVNGTANARYAKAYLFGTTHGVIIFPDSYTHPAGVTAPTGINATGSTSWSNNRYTATDWAKMEAAGCVFLPAAGRRDDTSIYNVNAYLRYWTSTYYNAGMAHSVSITDNNMNPADYNYKYFGYSVRLVHDAN